MSRIVQILVPTGLLLLVAVLWTALVLAAPSAQAESASLFLGPKQGTSVPGLPRDTATVTTESLAYQDQGDYPGIGSV